MKEGWYLYFNCILIFISNCFFYNKTDNLENTWFLGGFLGFCLFACFLGGGCCLFSFILFYVLTENKAVASLTLSQ